MLTIGTKNITGIFIGEKEVKKVFIGGNQIYPASSLSLSAIHLDFVAQGEVKDLTINAAEDQVWELTKSGNFEVSATTGTGTQSITITATNNTSTDQITGDIQVTSGDLTASCSLTQEAGIKVYGEITITSFTYATIPASGGTISPTISYSQPYTWNGVAGSGGVINSGASLQYSGNLVNTNNGYVTAPSKNTTISPKTTVTEVTVLVKLNNKQVESTSSVFQDINKVELIEFEPQSGSSSTTEYPAGDIPASGGTKIPNKTSQTRSTYSSGATEINTDGRVATRTWSMSNATGFTLDTGTGEITADNRGVIIGNRRSCNPSCILKVTFTNPESVGGNTVSDTLTESFTVYQEGNYVTELAILDGSMSYPTISASATSATPSIAAPYVKFIFSSNSATSNKPDSTYGSYSASVKFSLESVQNGFSAVNENSGILTATSRGTTIGVARTSGIVIRQTVATWTPTSAYNSAGTITTEYNLTATCTQDENTITSTEILKAEDASAPVISVPASQSVYGYTLRCYYSSGSTGSSVLPQSIINWSFDQTWGVLRDNEGSDRYYTYVEFSSRGTAIGAERSGLLVCTINGTINDVSINKTASLTITQAANYIESLKIGGNNLSTYISPGGSFTANENSHLYTGWATVSSGTDFPITTWVTGDWIVSQNYFSKASSEAGILKITAESRGTTTGTERGATLTWTLTSPSTNNKTLSTSINLTQSANQVESIKIGGNSGDSTVWGEPKVDVACTENEWWSYSCWATYSSNATKSILASDFTLTSNQSWATVSAGNQDWLKRVDFESRGINQGEERTVTLTAAYSNKTAIVSVKQEANNLEYVSITGLSTSDYAPLDTKFIASGETKIATTLAYYTSGSHKEITDSTFSNWNINGSGFSIASNQSYHYLLDITAENRGTTLGPIRYGTLSFSYEGKSTSIQVSQEANEEKSYSLYGGVQSKTPVDGGANDWMSARGGTFTFFTELRITYSSTEVGSRLITQDTEYVMDSGGYATVTGNKATIPGRGITIENARYCGFTQRYSIGGKTYTSWFNTAQNGNYVESIKGSLGTFSYPTISAGATSATPDLSVGFGVLFTFSSGSTSSNAPASTYGSLSVPSSFKLSASQNGFTSVNSSNGVLTATNRGTEIGAARTSGTVTRTLTATWTPTSSYNTAGTKTNSWSTTATCTQALNKVISLDIYSNPSSGYPAGDFPASGGKKSIQGLSAFRYTYSSGDYTNLPFDYTATRTYSMPATEGFSLDTTYGTLTAFNRGDIEGPRRSTTVSVKLTITYTNPSTVGGGTVSDTVTDNLTVYQEANSVTIQDEQINSFGYPTITYQAASYDPVIDISYTAKYTSGSSVVNHGLPSGYRLYYWITWASTTITDFVTVDSSTGKITVQENSNPTTRSFYVHVQLNGPSGNVAESSVTLTQQAVPHQYITLTLGYTSAGWVSITASSPVLTSLNVVASLFDPNSGMGEDVTINVQKGSTYGEALGNPGYPQASIASVNGTSTSPYKTTEADYSWSSSPISL